MLVARTANVLAFVQHVDDLSTNYTDQGQLAYAMRFAPDAATAGNWEGHLHSLVLVQDCLLPHVRSKTLLPKAGKTSAKPKRKPSASSSSPSPVAGLCESVYMEDANCAGPSNTRCRFSHKCVCGEEHLMKTCPQGRLRIADFTQITLERRAAGKAKRAKKASATPQ